MPPSTPASPAPAASAKASPSRPTSRASTTAVKRTRDTASSREGSASAPVVLDSDSEDEVVPPPKRQRAAATTTATSSASSAASKPATPAKPAASTLPLDRKQLEKERLERQRQRQQQQQPDVPPVEPASFYSSGERAAAAKPTADTTTAKPDAGLLFAGGAVRKTWAGNDAPPAADEIAIEQILDKEALRLGVFAAFQYDYEFLFRRLPLHRFKTDCRVVLVMQGKDAAERQMRMAQVGGLTGVDVVFPCMDGAVNCMHAKIMLLWQSRAGREWLRVAVGTGNLVDYDWGLRGGLMENMWWIVDLPRLPEARPVQTAFMREMLYFLGKMGVAEEVLARVVEYDFASTEGVGFVHTVGGSSFGEEAGRTGFCGLAATVRELGLQPGKGAELDYVTSSLGALKEPFLTEIYRATQGHDAIAAFASRGKGKGKATTSSTDSDSPEWSDIAPHFRIYYPSEQTITSSRGGKDAAGTICLNRKFYTDPTFPRHLLRDCESVRRGMLMHNKLIYVRPVHELAPKTGQKTAAWVYLGSANLSESAWGKLVLDRARKEVKLNCRNWECGVVLPVASEKVVGGQTLGGDQAAMAWPVQLRDVGRAIGVPMETPGVAIVETGREPWLMQFGAFAG